MKTELGVSVAVLAALAAHGKDFDRARADHDRRLEGRRRRDGSAD